jgi:16S rRNA (guanine1207-N2)-methyltransferase
VLRREGVEEVHLVEAEHDALAAARANITDPRARFHWADATRFAPDARFGAVVMNPPFHTGRSADPALGRAFIAAAARLLLPTGTLWMVANRHLPYERALAEMFREVEPLPGPRAYKILRASRPVGSPGARR